MKSVLPLCTNGIYSILPASEFTVVLLIFGVITLTVTGELYIEHTLDKEHHFTENITVPELRPISFILPFHVVPENASSFLILLAGTSILITYDEVFGVYQENLRLSVTVTVLTFLIAPSNVSVGTLGGIIGSIGTEGLVIGSGTSISSRNRDSSSV